MSLYHIFSFFSTGLSETGQFREKPPLWVKTAGEVKK
nr:MAG TPA: hypothetical protein [Caudoviricetes sp.]